jgi:ubiquinone/menaquinone biosynthesis C-methylase UbiE
MTSDKNNGIAPLGYHRHYYNDRNWQFYSDLLAMVVRHSLPGRILDLGAGCGYLVEAAKKWGIDSVGLEGSTEGVEMAKKRNHDIDIRVHQLSENLPFSTNTFQTVVLNQVIEHLEAEIMQHTLREAFRVLSAGGMLLVTSPSCFNQKELDSDATHINLISPSQLRENLLEAGFYNMSSFDSPLPIFGHGVIMIWVAKIIFKLLKIERMSATANAIAFKPNHE